MFSLHIVYHCKPLLESPRKLKEKISIRCQWELFTAFHHTLFFTLPALKTGLICGQQSTYTRSTLCIEHCFTDFKFKPLIYIYIYIYIFKPVFVKSCEVKYNVLCKKSSKKVLFELQPVLCCPQIRPVQLYPLSSSAFW